MHIILSFDWNKRWRTGNMFDILEINFECGNHLDTNGDEENEMWKMTSVSSPQLGQGWYY